MRTYTGSREEGKAYSVLVNYYGDVYACEEKNVNILWAESVAKYYESRGFNTIIKEEQ